MVQIIPKPTKEIPWWQNICFYFSLFLLVAVILTYFILGHLVKSSSQTLDHLKQTLEQKKTPEEKALEEKVFGYQKKIGYFSELIEKHLFPSKIFPFLEKNCHPKVWFSKFLLNPQEGKLTLSGQAEDFPTLDQQLQILKKEELVKNLKLSKISIGKEGKVDFTLDLSLDPKIFRK